MIEVSGRTYPVEVRYRPLGPEPRKAGQPAAKRPASRSSATRCRASATRSRSSRCEGPGDILVFLSGEREIRDTADAIDGLALPRHRDAAAVRPALRSRAAPVFSPHPGRRIVLATNVAETSLTVPGIRYVVDAGTARISRYSNRTKVQRLPIEPISQASANQRAGRCGRVADGICIRLYSEDRSSTTDRPSPSRRSSARASRR